jgi:hypothetical protein
VKGLKSALDAERFGGAKPGVINDDALVRGYSLADVSISDEDNIIIAAYLMDIMKTLMTAGYEVLVSDRGWWCAQVSPTFFAGVVLLKPASPF